MKGQTWKQASIIWHLKDAADLGARGSAGTDSSVSGDVVLMVQSDAAQSFSKCRITASK